MTITRVYKVRVQVIKVYDVFVDIDNPADDEWDNRDKAISTVYDMQSTDIEAEGDFVDVDVDYAEIYGVEEVEVNHATEME